MPAAKPITVNEYLDALPEDRRDAISAVRRVVKKNLPKGYAEFVGWGMINYGIPLTRYPNTYNGQPLCYIALASQKNYCSLYLMPAYGSSKHLTMLKDGFREAGKKLDMGKSCIRFKTIDDLPLDVIGSIVGSIPADKWIEIYEASRKGRS